MATKKVYHDDYVEMELSSNVNGIHLEVKEEDQEIPLILTLTVKDAEELIQDLTNHITKFQ